MSVEPFNKLVRLAARAFYDDITTKGDNQPKSGRSDNRGIAVVILDALTRRQWVREEDLAKDLKLHSKQLRRILRFFEEEKIVNRDHRRETAKGAKVFSAAVAATGDGQQAQKEGEEKIKLHTHSYCCLDYAQIYDVVRYRLHRMKKKLKDELEEKNTVQEYICPACGKRYNALDALRLISFDDDYFHCESCNGELVAESDSLAAQEMGDGDDNARRRRREKLKDFLLKLEVQLKPLMEQISRVKDLDMPEFGTLQAWEARASTAARGTTADAHDSSRSSHGFGGTPMPFVGETKVEVAIAGMEVKDEEDRKPEAAAAKVLPPWMIKQGMKLTDEQRGDVKPGRKKTDDDDQSAVSPDKKTATSVAAAAGDDDDEKNIKDEYVKAYYAALLQRQQEELAKEQENAPSSLSTSRPYENGVSHSDRRVGVKSKRTDDPNHDFDWEEEPLSQGVAGTPFEVNDLNAEARLGDNNHDDNVDDDDIEWEEG